jgi:phosphatidylserine decarboxylase
MKPEQPNSPPSRRPDEATVSDHLRNLPQYLYPQRLISRWVHGLTRVQTPWFRDLLIRNFIKRFGVDMNEAVDTDPGAYIDFNQFFTRPLRPDARPLAIGEGVLACPVDGFVSQAGTIDEDSLFQAKGRTFSLIQLLGGDVECARPFRHGCFATFYLSPRDYHRVHMPARGLLRKMIHIPGRLFSVSPLTTRVVPRLFVRNERVITIFDTQAGPMAMILVGAINVSSIETVWAGTITPAQGKQIRHWNYPTSGSQAVILEKGEEMGRFNMGSTVIVLFGQGAVRWDPAIHPNAIVRMGQRLGEMVLSHDSRPVDGEGQHLLEG